MNSYADKENFNSRNIPSKSNFGKARGFSALLESATKENENELNYSVAVKAQCQDINSMVDKLVGDFRQEDKDCKYAKQLYDDDMASEKKMAEEKHMRQHKDEHTAKELYMEELNREKEIAAQRRQAEHKDESAALSVAMQERREVQKRAQAKRDLEAKDCDFAKQTILDDMAAQQDMEDKCSHDGKYALEVRRGAVTAHAKFHMKWRASNNYSPLSCTTQLKQQLEDEMYAEELQDKVEREARTEAARQCLRDQELAQQVECNLRLHEEAQTREQEANDRRLASKLLTQSARQAYEETFSSKTRKMTEDFSMSAIAAQWENADVDFADVSGGICITLLLPHLADLKVSLLKDHLISIEARRTVMTGDVHANRSNTFYAAEFEIRGKKIRLSSGDINYNYASETGLLHIYVENVSLTGMAGEESSSVMSNMKSTFARLFSK